MIPLIPILCALGIVAGAGGLAWYESLSDDEKQKADRMAGELAWKLYQKSVKNLTRDQADRIATIVRERLGA